MKVEKRHKNECGEKQGMFCYAVLFSFSEEERGGRARGTPPPPLMNRTKKYFFGFVKSL
jgi:hypothetical protein